MEDQNAYDEVVVVLVSGDLDSAKFGRLLSRTLNISHQQIKRARAICHDIEDKTRWVRELSAVPNNAIGEGDSDDVGILKHLYYLSLNYIYFILIVVQNNSQSIKLQYLNICTQKNAVGLITMIR